MSIPGNNLKDNLFMTPAAEWKPLPTMSDVACAQADGWEIESLQHGRPWSPWLGKTWFEDVPYRARPRQPKVQVVQSLCWRGPSGQLAWWDDSAGLIDPWFRFPAGDIEGEVAL